MSQNQLSQSSKVKIIPTRHLKNENKPLSLEERIKVLEEWKNKVETQKK